MSLSLKLSEEMMYSTCRRNMENDNYWFIFCKKYCFKNQSSGNSKIRFFVAT